MIERYVFLKLDDSHATAQGRATVAAETRQRLADLPGVRGLRVGLPADDRAAQAWDLSIAVVFDDLEAVETYRVHPDHRAYVDASLRPMLAKITAWNFELPLG